MRKGIEFIRKVDEAWVPSVMLDGSTVGLHSSMGFTEASAPVPGSIRILNPWYQ